MPGTVIVVTVPDWVIVTVLALPVVAVLLPVVVELLVLVVEVPLPKLEVPVVVVPVRVALVPLLLDVELEPPDPVGQGTSEVVTPPLLEVPVEPLCEV